MTVMVDRLSMCLPNIKWKGNEYCHLFADSVTELHLFAEKLGLKGERFQDYSKLPHYDLTNDMRIKAIKIGAIEVGRKEVVEYMKKEW